MVGRTPANQNRFKSILNQSFSMQKSHDVLRQAYAKCPAKKIAAEMKLSASMVQKWAEPAGAPNSGLINPLERVAQLWVLTQDDRLLDWLCAQAGGMFVRGREMPGYCRRWWTQLKGEMEQLFKRQDKTGKAESRRPAVERASCHWRRRDGRCGFGFGRDQGLA
jgi:hypothetical protein